MKLKRIERGWAGHFICGNWCRFKRNTLIANGKRGIIVSTVGNYHPPRGENTSIESIGCDRYYETMIFESKKDGCYIETNVQKEISLPSKMEWGIFGKSEKDLPDDVDNKADKIHEKAVDYVMNNFKRLRSERK